MCRRVTVLVIVGDNEWYVLPLRSSRYRGGGSPEETLTLSPLYTRPSL